MNTSSSEGLSFVDGVLCPICTDFVLVPVPVPHLLNDRKHNLQNDNRNSIISLQPEAGIRNKINPRIVLLTFGGLNLKTIGVK